LRQQVSPNTEELDREVDRLTAKVGDLDLEKQNLADELAQVRAELETLRRSSTSDSTILLNQLPEPLTLLNQLRGKLPKTKVTSRDIEAILELL
jgi:predicted RNase H-like nuclease (RuvC/YqgF family)